MAGFMKHRLSRFSTRIFLFIAVIGILPVLILGVFSYSQASEAMQGRVQLSNAQAIERASEQLDEALMNIRDNYINLAFSYLRAYEDVSMETLFNEYDQMIELQQRMFDYQRVEPAVHSAYFINLKHDWIIGNHGIGVYSELEQHASLKELLEKEDISAWVNSGGPETATTHMNISRQIPLTQQYLFIKFPVHRSEASGFLVVNVDKQSLTDLLPALDENRNVVVLDKNYTLNLSGDAVDPWVMDSIDELTRQDILRQGDRGFNYVTLGDTRAGLSFIRSAYNGWTYVILYSVAEITSASRSIGAATLIISASTILLILFLSMLFSSLLMRPIRHTYKVAQDEIADFALDLGEDEFEYIDRCIHELVDSRSVLERKIRDQIDDLREALLLDLVAGRVDEAVIPVRLKKLGYSTRLAQYYVLSFQLLKSPASDQEQPDELHLLALRDFIRRQIQDPRANDWSEAFVCFPPALYRGALLMILGTEDRDREAFSSRLYTRIVDLQQDVELRMGSQLLVGFSSSSLRLGRARTAYHESLEALMFRESNPDKNIFFYSEFSGPATATSSPYPDDLENTLLNAVHRTDEQAAKDALDKLLEKLHEETRNPQLLHIYLVRISVNILRILQDIGEDITFIDQGGLLFDQLRLAIAEGALADFMYKRILGPCMNVLRERRGRHNRVILDQLLKIMDSEYDKDISLEYCAGKLQYHPSYLWRVLKDELNTTFSDYIGNRRMSVAKQWLIESDRSIGDIAQSLCYSNSQNFIRFFKRSEGITPGQYREQHKST